MTEARQREIQPPGSSWPTPAPLAPEAEGRAWWKVAVPAAVIVVLLAAGLAVALGGSDGNDASTPAPSSTAVDISDLDDPATSSAQTSPSTTLVAEADGRFRITSESGISWTMAAAPDQEDLVATDDPPTEPGTSWTAEAGGGTTEVVEIVDLGEDTFDADAAFAEIATRFDGDLSEVADSHIATADGDSASFEGVLDGTPVVGYVVAAKVDDQGLIMMTYREDADLPGLLLDFLGLPSSVSLP